MATSNRVPIPSEYQYVSGSLDEMRHSVVRLGQFDTPQILPQLARYDSRAPGWTSLIIGSIWSNGLGVIGLAVLALLLVAGWIGLLVLYATVFGLFSLTDIGIVGGAGLLWWLALLLFDKKTWETLKLKDFSPNAILPIVLGIILWIGRIVAIVMAGGVMGFGTAAMLLPCLYGVIWFLTSMPSPESAIVFYGGLALFVIFVAVLFATVFRPVPIVVLWGIGLAGLGVSAFLAPDAVFIVAAISVLAPLRIIYWLAGRCLAAFKWWQSRLIWSYEGWRLRGALSEAFTYHKRRNISNVGNDGSKAFCKTDLARFTRQRAGPVTFWWCPNCHDDTPVYAGIHKVRGILDMRMATNEAQDGSSLRINLRARFDNAHLPMPAALNEVVIGPLNDNNEAELFITQYQTYQTQKGWPPLRQIRCVILPEANLDDNIQRLIQRNFRQ